MEKKIISTDDLGQTIQEARKAQGLSQVDLAGLAGLGRRFVSNLENGKASAQVGKVLRVLNTLGVSITASSTWGD